MTMNARLADFTTKLGPIVKAKQTKNRGCQGGSKSRGRRQAKLVGTVPAFLNYSSWFWSFFVVEFSRGLA